MKRITSVKRLMETYELADDKLAYRRLTKNDITQNLRFLTPRLDFLLGVRLRAHAVAVMERDDMREMAELWRGTVAVSAAIEDIKKRIDKENHR